MAKKKETATKRPVVTQSSFQKYVDDMYDHGLDHHEVSETLNNVKVTRRKDPKARDFDNEYVWNTSDRLDRALTIAQRRLTLIGDHQKRLKEIDGLLDALKLQMGQFGDPEKARVLLNVTRMYMAQPVAPWADKALTSDMILCSICRCAQCDDRINGQSAHCCDHKDDTGSWGLPF